jgi:hypothetical protein
MSDLIKELAEEVKAEIISDNVTTRSNIQELQKTPDPPPSLAPTTGLGTPCHICGKAELYDPYIESKGLAMIEKFHYLQKLADRVGWKYTIKIVDDESFVEFICPCCIHGKFNSKASCPKCGGKKLGAKYNNGSSSPLGMQKENIERRCDRCGFLFCQNTIDE